MLARTVQRLAGDALTPAARAQRRRDALGREGRLAEDVVTLVEACARIWEDLAAKELPQDLTLAELRHLTDLLDDRELVVDGDRRPAPLTVSIAVAEPEHLGVVRALVPGGLDASSCDAYRYAVLQPRSGAPEPFLVALHRGDPVGSPWREADVVAVVLLAPTFLRYEQEMGAVNPLAVQALEDVVRADLAAVLETRDALGEA
ncbi:MAG: hypothetical protein ACTHQ3_09590 [Motilibacteraceae bacterium]